MKEENLGNIIYMSKDIFIMYNLLWGEKLPVVWWKKPPPGIPWQEEHVSFIGRRPANTLPSTRTVY